MSTPFRPNIIGILTGRGQQASNNDSLLLLPSRQTVISYSIFYSSSLTSLRTSCRCSWGKPSLCMADRLLCWKWLGSVSRPQGSHQSYSCRQMTWHWHWLLRVSLCKNNWEIISFKIPTHLIWIQSTPLNHTSFWASSTLETLCLTSWHRASMVWLAASDMGISGGKTRQSFQSLILR